MTSYTLVNQCSDAALTPELLARIASALEVQLNRDVGPIHGGNYRVRAATTTEPPAEGDVVALLVDSLPSDPSAVAYHDWTGHPEIYVSRAQCLSLISGDLSLSQALSHELVEAVGDAGCNVWVDDGIGNEWARELCDAVESGYYDIDGITVSDFLFPSFFEMGALAPYSQLQAQGGAGPATPFQTAVGGYQIERSSGAGERQVTARFEPSVTIGLSIPFGRRAEKKRHWSSRTFRRGLRV